MDHACTIELAIKIEIPASFDLSRRSLIDKLIDSIPPVAKMPSSPPLLFLLFVAVFSACSLANMIRVDLRHIDSGGSFSKQELLQRAAERTMHRMASLQAMRQQTNVVEAPLHPGTFEYLMDLAIGTPPLSFSAIADTGSDLIWTQCQPCTQCFPQPTPIYDPSKSHTYTTLPCTSSWCEALGSSCPPADCNYSYSYGGNTTTEGVLGTETFTFGVSAQEVVRNIVFGCGTDNSGGVGIDNSAGLVGLGRGPLSLVSQLGDGRFSYCLTPFGDNKTSPLLFGSLANPSPRARSTPFARNPSPLYSTFYYLSLQGITVGATLLPIPQGTFVLNPNGTGGLIIDSGTTFTMLRDPAYTVLKQAFVFQTNLPMVEPAIRPYDLCFSFPPGTNTPAVPRLVFHFDGADMNFPTANYFDSDSTEGLMCLSIVRSPSIMSTLGNKQQQNMHLVYDLPGGMLSFEPANCDQM